MQTPITIGVNVSTPLIVNIRSGPGRSYGKIGELSYTDDPLPVVDGPVDADGLRWWGVQSAGKVGWCAESVGGRPLLIVLGEAPPLVDRLSAQYDVDAAVIRAVMQVESGGRGFEDGRLVIRFEPHVFKQRAATSGFERLFTVGNPSWDGNQHRMRMSPRADWVGFHGKQDGEWQALSAATMIDADAAWESCSMGAPQIMGFHSAMLGYPSASAMALAFSESEDVQVESMFRWMNDSGALAALKAGDYLSFAKTYNGSANASHYAQLIKQLVAA